MKFAPRIGLLTSARWKIWLVCKPGNLRCKDLVPNVRMVEPLAATKLEETAEGAVFFAGKTHTLAPLSTRKLRPLLWSWRERQRGDEEGGEEEEEDARRLT